MGLTPNALTLLAALLNVGAAAAILADDGTWLWTGAILLEVALLLGVMARHRTDFGSFFARTSEVFGTYPAVMAAAWVESNHGGGMTILVLAAVAAYGALTLGYMRWVAESTRPRPAASDRARWLMGPSLWLGLALVTGKVTWFLWAAAMLQGSAALIMAVVRGRRLVEQDAARRKAS